MKGQAAFETIFILLIILSATIYLSSLYIQTNDITMAEIIARNEVTTQATLLSEKVVIQSVNYNSNLKEITITILAQNPTKIIINTDPIIEKIANNTSIKSSTIKTNIKQL